MSDEQATIKVRVLEPFEYRNKADLSDKFLTEAITVWPNKWLGCVVFGAVGQWRIPIARHTRSNRSVIYFC